MVGWNFFSWHTMDVVQTCSLAPKCFLTSSRAVTPLDTDVALPVLAATLFELQNVVSKSSDI